MAEPLRIEVVHALAERQLVIALEVPPGITARGAVERAGLAAQVAGLDPATARYALFGKAVSADRVLRDGDRIDVLRPLLADPKEIRRALAAQGGRRGGGPAHKRR